MDYLSACAVVKDEGEYLPEWVTYHRLMGVTRFVIYDNGSSIPIDKSAAALSMGDIYVMPFRGRGRQIEAYTDCAKRLSGKTTWLSLTDIDEFLVPKAEAKLTDLLRSYEEYGALAVNWQTFGSSGHKSRPKGLQMDQFKLRSPIPWGWNQHVKLLVRPERVDRAISPHECIYKMPYGAVNERGVPVSGPFSVPVSVDRIQVNHYFTRSRQEYDTKMARGAADGTFKPPEFFSVVDDVAKEEDASICRFSRQVKALML